MTLLRLMAEWTLRSSILIVCGALVLRALRIESAALRLAAWVGMLCASLAMPLLMASLPVLPVGPAGGAGLPARALPNEHDQTVVYDSIPTETSAARPFDWATAGAVLYALVTGAMLLRLCAGAAMGARLLRRSRATGSLADGVPIRESDRVSAPATLGIVRPAIVLPMDWRDWDEAKLDAVLAHERSHARRKDPAVQFVSAAHRALLWLSPLSWYLHRRIVRVAEEASDDAAVAAAPDRAAYAAILLDFIGHRAAGPGVAMARYDRPEHRIRRILNGTGCVRGVTLRGVAAIVALGSPLAYVVAAAHPQQQPAEPAPAPPQVAASPQAAAPPQAQTAPQASSPAGRIRRYVIVTGNDTTTESWDSDSPVDSTALRARYGRRFAWFQQDGNTYVVTDGGVMQELDKAMEPQRNVNRMQSDVNTQQSQVNALQSTVNTHQNEVNHLQNEVNRTQDLVNRIQAAVNTEDRDKLIERLREAIRTLEATKEHAGQQDVNKRQAQVNEEQSRVNAEQGKVNVAQQKVNEEQHRVSQEFSRRIQEILDSAVRQGLAQRLI
jgi:hypothetical protein